MGALFGLYWGGHYYRIASVAGVLPESVRSFFFSGSNLVQLGSQIEGILDSGYYQPVHNSSLENAAINGMVGSLNDPYTEYFTPDEYQQFEDQTQGTFVGIGVTIEPQGGDLTVVSVLDNSPAQQAGIQAGDLIIAINGQSLSGKTADQAEAAMKGKEGTTLTLHIKRGQQEFDKSAVRKSLALPIESDKMLNHNGKKIGYIRLDQFSVGAGTKVRAADDKLVKEGARGIILDLRNNGGGLLDEAVSVGSVFIKSGVIVSVAGRDSGKQTYNAQGGANATIPLVVLVNGYTASASEIVAGAIKDDHRGLLIGQKTFGKGVVQSLDPLGNGGALKFTSGSYYTPSGANINKIGIQPNIQATDNPNTPADEVIERGLAALAP